MTINEFIKSMAAEGFNGKFKATNGEHSYRGEIDDKGVITTVKIQTIAESKSKINDIFKNNK